MVALFFAFVIVALICIGLIVLFSPDARATRAKRRDDAAVQARDKADADAARAREKIATKALRAIANGAGNPIFEAQDALDNIESTYTKEIS